MNQEIDVQPLPHNKRQGAFFFLVGVFVVSIPFLYMYATGYRFDLQRPTTLVSTGGLYISVALPDAEIYVDDELIRETRVFRKAFYAQGLNAGTHKVHVQKDGFHTWVKELPVSKHLVTEAEAFHFPLVPQVRVISEWQSATGSMIIPYPLVSASGTNLYIATTTMKASTLVRNDEFHTRVLLFSTTSTSTVEESTARQIKDIIRGTTTPVEAATTTVISGDVRLYEAGDDVYATWIGSFEHMPYYYCAADFERYNPLSATSTLATTTDEESVAEAEVLVDPYVTHPVQTVPEDTNCDPTIRIDRKSSMVHDFDFYPGSTDLVLMVLEDGIYAVEIDDRAWQNVQPVFYGNNLRMSIDGGNMYVYDGMVIYQVMNSIE